VVDHGRVVFLPFVYRGFTSLTFTRIFNAKLCVLLSEWWNHPPLLVATSFPLASRPPPSTLHQKLNKFMIMTFEKWRQLGDFYLFIIFCLLFSSIIMVSSLRPYGLNWFGSVQTFKTPRWWWFKAKTLDQTYHQPKE